MYSETKFYRNPSGGHGFAAESANNLNDKLKGKRAEITGIDNKKNGADRIIKRRNTPPLQIQDKYYRTATESINSAFGEDGNYRYKTSDNSPMLLEVPSNQYDDAVKLFAKKSKMEKFQESLILLKHQRSSKKEALLMNKLEILQKPVI